jgi:hypothetical protein
MKSVQMLLTQLFALFTGMTMSSLWITKSESYKIYIPIVLIILLVKLIISDKRESK